MRILFVSSGTENKKTNNINGENFRYENGKAISGTEQSIIIVAEELVKLGHTCFIALPKTDNHAVYKGVEYIDLFAYWDRGRMEIDMIIIPGWFTRFEFIFQKVVMEKVSKIGIWLHCPYYHNKHIIESISNDLKIKKYLIHISKWSRSVVGDLDGYISCTIPNGLLTHLIKEKPINKEPNSFIFHACWERGGDVANRVATKLNGTLYRYDYFVLSKNLCKVALFNEMDKIDYFVYPLVLPAGNIHKDTHACVVAEAMAKNIIVITYPVAALVTTYPSDCIVFVDFPKDANVKEITGYSPHTTDKSLLSEEAVDIFCQKIKYLEENKDVKESIRKRAREFVMTSFNEEKIGKMFNYAISV